MTKEQREKFEKQIAQEKRIAELEYQLTHRNCLDCSNHSSKLRMKVLELEKENAELKEIIKTLEQIKQEHTNYTIKVEEERTFVRDQLAKAKEIIKTCLGFMQTFGYSPSMDKFITQAEKLLKEIE